MSDVRDDIARAALAVARHVHDGGYAAVIVSGGSNQLSRALLALSWGILYPGMPMPKIFVLDAHANRLLYKWTGDDKAAAQELSVWMKTHMSELESLKEARLCFVDDFALSGLKYSDVRRMFGRMRGFHDVRFAFFAAKEDTELGEDAFVGVRSGDVVAELHRLSQNIQGKEHVKELLDGIGHSAREIRREALGELRDIGGEMKRNV